MAVVHQLAKCYRVIIEHRRFGLQGTPIFGDDVARPTHGEVI